MEGLKLPKRPEMRVRGAYETTTTDTKRLAAELASPRNLTRVIHDFDEGNTPLRDVGGMVTAQRTAILRAYATGTLSDMARREPKLLTTPVENLHQRVTAGMQDQPVGHNFFVNATGFLDQRWGQQFDALVQRRSRRTIIDIAQSRNLPWKDHVLAALTQNPDPETARVIATYLAGRSLESEKYLESLYGDVLTHAKGEVLTATRRMSSVTGLSKEMLHRAIEQMNRTRFGSFDHLDGLVTSGNTGAAGDYLIGSLRVEVQFAGDVQSSRLRSKEEARHVLSHELQHASSAQILTSTQVRCGLSINGQGLEANEGMSEYLAQLSIGSPGIEFSRSQNTVRASERLPYRLPTIAILLLHEEFKKNENRHFATLFNAYHGDVKSTKDLERAFDAFYQHDIALARDLRR